MMQKMIPFSPLLIDALKLNLMIKNAYNPLGPKDIFSLPNNTLMQMILLPVKYLVKETLKRGKGLTYSTCHTNASPLPSMVIAFCSLYEKEKKILPKIFGKEILLLSCLYFKSRPMGKSSTITKNCKILCKTCSH